MMMPKRKGNVLFNDAHNTFYLRLYGVRHVVKDHSDSEKGNPLPPHRLLLSINSKGSFICTIPQTFVTPVVEHWLEREIAQWVHHEVKNRSDDPSHHERTLLPRSYISLLNKRYKYNIIHFITHLQMLSRFVIIIVFRCSTSHGDDVEGSHFLSDGPTSIEYRCRSASTA